MKCATQTALAVGAGYVLGRRHKMRWALGLAAATVTGRFGGMSGQLLKRGTKLIGSSDALGKLSPDLTEVTDMIRGDLMDVGKAAALAAVRNRIDRVSDRLHEQAESLREGGGQGRGGRGRADDEEEPADYEDTEDTEDAEDYDEPEDDREPARDEDEDEPAEDRPARRRSRAPAAASAGRRVRAAAGNAPVRRARR